MNGPLDRIIHDKKILLVYIWNIFHENAMVKQSLFLGLFLLASNAIAQTSSPLGLTPHYVYHPGTTLHYVVTDDKTLTDPDHTAKYTDEYSDTSHILLHVDSVRQNGVGVVTIEMLSHTHVDRSKSPDGNGKGASRGTFTKRVRFVVDGLGNLIDSTVLEYSDADKKERSRAGEKMYAQLDHSTLRHTHRDFLAMIPHSSRAANQMWSDTEKQLVTRYGISSGASQIDNNGQAGMTTIRSYRLKPGTRRDGVECNSVILSETVTTSGEQPRTMNEVADYRISDGALQYRETEARAPQEGKYVYITRKVVKLDP